jgi:hypothetical protein
MTDSVNFFEPMSTRVADASALASKGKSRPIKTTSAQTVHAVGRRRCWRSTSGIHQGHAWNLKLELLAQSQL